MFWKTEYVGNLIFGPVSLSISLSLSPCMILYSQKFLPGENFSPFSPSAQALMGKNVSSHRSFGPMLMITHSLW